MPHCSSFPRLLLLTLSVVTLCSTLFDIASANVGDNIKHAAGNAGDAMSAEVERLKSALASEKKTAAEASRKLLEQLNDKKREVEEWAKQATGKGNDDLMTSLRKEVTSLKKQISEQTTKMCHSGHDSVHNHIYNFQRSKKDFSDIGEFMKAIVLHGFTSIQRGITHLVDKLPHDASKPVKQMGNTFSAQYDKHVTPMFKAATQQVSNAGSKVQDLLGGHLHHHQTMFEKINTAIDNGIEKTGFYHSNPHLRQRVPPSLMDKIVAFLYIVLGGYFVYLMPTRYIYYKLFGNNGWCTKRKEQVGTGAGRRQQGRRGDTAKSKNA